MSICKRIRNLSSISESSLIAMNWNDGTRQNKREVIPYLLEQPDAGTVQHDNWA